MWRIGASVTAAHRISNIPFNVWVGIGDMKKPKYPMNKPTLSVRVARPLLIALTFIVSLAHLSCNEKEIEAGSKAARLIKVLADRQKKEDEKRKGEQDFDNKLNSIIGQGGGK